MLDPLTYTLKVQQAAFVGTLCAAGIAAANWARILRGEQAILATPVHRRAEEKHTQPAYIAKGAAWSDHYGRRAHDIDVEHMR